MDIISVWKCVVQIQSAFTKSASWWKQSFEKSLTIFQKRFKNLICTKSLQLGDKISALTTEAKNSQYSLNFDSDISTVSDVLK